MTNESLKKRVIDDINYIKTESENLEKRLINHNLSSEISKQIQSVLDYFAITDFSFIDGITQQDLLNMKNIFSPYKISMESFIVYPENDRLKKFIEANAKMYEVIQSIKKITKEEVLPSIDPENLHDELQKIYKRIDDLENKPDKLLLKAQESLDKIEKLQNTAESDVQYFSKINSQINDFVQDTTTKVGELILNLETIRDKEISFILAKQFGEKTEILKLEAEQKLGQMSFNILLIYSVMLTAGISIGHYFPLFIKYFFTDIQDIPIDFSFAFSLIGFGVSIIFFILPLRLLHWNRMRNEEIKKPFTLPLFFPGFYGAITLTLFLNAFLWSLYFWLSFEHYIALEFWNFMMLKLTINIPLFVYIAFTLNEYSKAKKLYEEFDYKRIMTITMVNNYNQLKNELGLDSDKAFELIKTPFEKLFDNPVHSIYGDKSGDKNIGLDQLEKITSIIEKMKSK